MIVKVKNPVMSLNLMKIKCDLVSIIEDEINIKTSLLNILNVVCEFEHFPALMTLIKSFQTEK